MQNPTSPSNRTNQAANTLFYGAVAGCVCAISGAILLALIVLVFILKTSGDDIGGPLFLPLVELMALFIGALVGGLCGFLGGIIVVVVRNKRAAHRLGRPQ